MLERSPSLARAHVLQPVWPQGRAAPVIPPVGSVRVPPPCSPRPRGPTTTICPSLTRHSMSALGMFPSPERWTPVWMKVTICPPPTYSHSHRRLYLLYMKMQSWSVRCPAPPCLLPSSPPSHSTSLLRKGITSNLRLRPECTCKIAVSHPILTMHTTPPTILSQGKTASCSLLVAMLRQRMTIKAASQSPAHITATGELLKGSMSRSKLRKCRNSQNTTERPSQASTVYSQ